MPTRKIKTRFEHELARARVHCRRAEINLGRSWMAKLFAPEEHRYLTEMINRLLDELDAIYGVINIARRSIRDSQEIKRVLKSSRDYDLDYQSRPVVQLISPESAVAEQLFKVHRREYDTIDKLNVMLVSFNSQLRSLQLYLDRRPKARWILSMIVAVLPFELDLQLIGEFYDDSLNFHLSGEVIDVLPSIDD